LLSNGVWLLRFSTFRNILHYKDAHNYYFRNLPKRNGSSWGNVRWIAARRSGGKQIFSLYLGASILIDWNVCLGPMRKENPGIVLQIMGERLLLHHVPVVLE